MNSVSETIQYVIRFEDRRRHGIHVEMWLGGVDSKFTVAFPVWTPGSYLIREYARNIESISATCHRAFGGDSDGEVRLAREGKNRWVGEAADANFICISYRLYCREMTVRTNWVEMEYAFLTGAATFPFLVGDPGACSVCLELPSDWKDVTTPLQLLPAPEGGGAVFSADSYDELVDSPIVCGNFESRQFDCQGVQHHLVHVGDPKWWDLDQATEDTQKIVEGHQRFWGDVPYRNYWFINLGLEGRGGLEHDNSTVLMCSRDAMQDRETYVDWLGLVSHEFFHTWNVRRLRPKALMQYDYEREQFFEELWIAEGITSYFDDLSLARLGLCTEEEYLSRLSKTISVVQSAPGRLVQDLKSSSWDAWTKLYRPDENSPNARISYYSKGALVSWLLDVAIGRATDGKRALDDVVRFLWNRHAEEGYTQADFDRIVTEVAGAEVTHWLQRQISESAELDFEPALHWLGLQFRSPADTGSNTEPWIGWEFAEGQYCYIARVLRGSPADQAGINVADEILAMDGYRVTKESLAKQLKTYGDGAQLPVLIARRGKVHSVHLRLNAGSKRSWHLASDPTAGVQAIARREKWLRPSAA